MADAIPPFDPNKPYTVAKGAAAAPPFDPSKPYTVAGDKAAQQQTGAQTGAAGLVNRVREALTGTHGIFGPDYLKGSAEGLKQMGRTLGQSLLPGAAGARAGGEVAGGALESSGAFAGGEMAPKPVTRVPAGGGSAAQRLLQDFRAVGVPPSMPAVGGGRASGIAANLGRTLPFSPVSRAVDTGISKTASATERVAGQYGAAQPDEAGSIAQNAVRRFASDKSQATSDYAAFDRVMHGAPPAPVTRTVKLLQDLRGRFPNAPGLAGLLTNPKLSRLAGELEPQTTTIAAKTSPVLGPSGQPIVTQAARTVQTGGKLSMPELRELRSQIGYMIEQPQFGPEAIPKAQLRRVYGALTQDMQEAARARGPAAVKALNQATINYGTRMKTLERLDPILRTDAPERSFLRLNQAASTSGSADAGLLRAAKTAMTPEEWGDIGAATIRKMGMPTPGAASTGPFSVGQFSTNYAKLSDHAKDLLFGIEAPGSPRAGLESLSRVVDAQKNVSRLANTSHSAEMVAVYRTAETVLATLAAGKFPWATALFGSGTYGASKLLMSPAFTSWWYQLPTIVKGEPNVTSALPRAVAALQAAVVADRAGGGPAPAFAAPERPAPRPTQAPETARDYLDRRARGGERGPIALPSGITVQAPAQ